MITQSNNVICENLCVVPHKQYSVLHILKIFAVFIKLQVYSPSKLFMHTVVFYPIVTFKCLQYYLLLLA